MDILLYAELAINGALVGLMYALVALGIVLVYKASGYANLAQGAFAMTGGYACLLITTALGVPMWTAALLSLVVLFFAGVLVWCATLFCTYQGVAVAVHWRNCRRNEGSE